MFYDNLIDIRQQFITCWANYRQRKPLSPLEQQLVDVIIAHPEFHADLEAGEPSLTREYFPALGETNPFLHLGLHLAIREQIQTNRPAGIRAIYHQLTQQHAPLASEHLLMDCLAECLWQAQGTQTAPDTSSYLHACRQLIIRAD